ncbi:MAG TPA: PIG-L deacetylase family protein [Candidatus Krumholzibacteria bacterium]
MKRLLCVFAHPDDECLGPGGTIAQCALDGGEVFITTFTAGEAGTIGISKTLRPDELARRRRAELAAACDALGVSGHRILGVPDGGVRKVDAAWAVREIVDDIRHFKPQIVLTFHHLGVSGHPDHIAVAAFLDEAFALTPDGPQAYYGWGIPASKVALYDRPNLVPMPEPEVVARVTPGEHAMERKIAAIRAHETQIAFFLSLQEKIDYRALSSPEHFALRSSRVRQAPAYPVTDLWDGVV